MKKSLTDRFLAKVERIPGFDCWVWIGCLNNKGYGTMNAPEAGTTLAPRISWILHKGALSHADMVLHRCDVPSCVNPEHLFIGNQTMNMRDMANKRRHPFCKLSEKSVHFIRSERARGVTLDALAQQLGVSIAAISRAHRSVTWAAQ